MCLATASIALCAAVVVLTASTAAAPPETSTRSSEESTPITKLSPPPAVTARGWLVYDAEAKELIAGTDTERPRPIASLAKLMTALIAVERTQPDDMVTVPKAATGLPRDAAKMGARAGERWSARDLLNATLTHSANDAALALASEVSDGDIDAFVKLMNERAEEIGMSGTTFASPTGLDRPGATSTSTPTDMVMLAAIAMKDQSIRTAVAEPSITLQRDGGAEIELPNRNPLIGTYAGVDGVKTGHTDAAGYMLLVHHHDSETDGDLFVATFASTTEATRIKDATALLDWGRSLRVEVRIAEGGEPLGTIPVQRSSERMPIFACDDLFIDVRPTQRVRAHIVVPRSVVAPVSAGDEVGTLRVRVGNSGNDSPATQSVPICSGTSIRRRTRLDRFRDYARDYRRAWKLGSDEVQDAWTSIRKHVA